MPRDETDIWKADKEGAAKAAPSLSRLNVPRDQESWFSERLYKNMGRPGCPSL